LGSFLYGFYNYFKKNSGSLRYNNEKNILLNMLPATKKQNFEFNLAFIDGQNLYMGTKLETPPWKIDLKKFRDYLRKKYKVKNAYYFLGFFIEKNQELYGKIIEAEYILKFRSHNSSMMGNKKGNVDADIVFCIMKMLYKQEKFEN